MLGILVATACWGVSQYCWLLSKVWPVVMGSSRIAMATAALLMLLALVVAVPLPVIGIGNSASTFGFYVVKATPLVNLAQHQLNASPHIRASVKRTKAFTSECGGS